MLTISCFLKEMERLYNGFQRKYNQETVDLFYSLSRRKLPAMGNSDFKEIVVNILLNESCFPSFSKIAEYYAKFNTVERKEADLTCEYCHGIGKVIYERYIETQDAYISFACNCICGSRTEGIPDIEKIGLKKAIDAGKMFLDGDKTYRREERLKFKSTDKNRIRIVSG